MTERLFSVRVDASDRAPCEGFRGLMVDTLEDRGRARLAEDPAHDKQKRTRRKVRY